MRYIIAMLHKSYRETETTNNKEALTMRKKFVLFVLAMLIFMSVAMMSLAESSAPADSARN